MEAIDEPLYVHWLRHGEVASHQGDIPLTPTGRQQVMETGQRLGGEFTSNEHVFLFHAPTRRTYETATLLHHSMSQILANAQPPKPVLHEPGEERAIRNPDIYVAGKRVELVSSAEALAEQLSLDTPGIERLSSFAFWQGFWSTRDRIGFWVNHPDPPGEDANAVARRFMAFALSLLDLPRTRPRRYICVTHSPTMRAFLRHYLLKNDPGEPKYGESVDLIMHNKHIEIRFREASKKIIL